MSNVETKFFTFRQNNSGGSFDYKESKGIVQYVVVQAVDAAHANARAEAAGLYFNGCDYGVDCPCCGDRWCAVEDDDANTQPEVDGRPLDELQPYRSEHRYAAAVHYLDGRIELAGARGGVVEDY